MFSSAVFFALLYKYFYVLPFIFKRIIEEDTADSVGALVGRPIWALKNTFLIR